jgi:hypothetical protein
MGNIVTQPQGCSPRSTATGSPEVRMVGKQIRNLDGKLRFSTNEDGFHKRMMDNISLERAGNNPDVVSQFVQGDAYEATAESVAYVISTNSTTAALRRGTQEHREQYELRDRILHVAAMANINISFNLARFIFPPAENAYEGHIGLYDGKSSTGWCPLPSDPPSSDSAARLRVCCENLQAHLSLHHGLIWRDVCAQFIAKIATELGKLRPYYVFTLLQDVLHVFGNRIRIQRLSTIMADHAAQYSGTPLITYDTPEQWVAALSAALGAVEVNTIDAFHLGLNPGSAVYCFAPPASLKRCLTVDCAEDLSPAPKREKRGRAASSTAGGGSSASTVDEESDGNDDSDQEENMGQEVDRSLCAFHTLHLLKCDNGQGKRYKCKQRRCSFLHAHSLHEIARCDVKALFDRPNLNLSKGALEALRSFAK